jgi:primosomal protein N' (replication factor Y) (superfamily II helicase)
MVIEQSIFADVILPLAVPQYYTYKVPDELLSGIKIGSRVTVALGKRRLYTAIVRRLHQTEPTGFEIRNILTLLDDNPIVNSIQINFWEWLADYYMCTPGEVYKAALPSGLKLESETRVFLNKIDDTMEFSPIEISLISLVEDSPGITINKLNIATDRKDLMPVVKNLIDKGTLTIEEFLKENYKPRFRESIILKAEWQDENRISELLNKFEKRAPKQAELIIHFLRLGDFSSDKKNIEVSKELLMNSFNSTPSILSTLVKKNIFEISRIEISRLTDNSITTEPKELNEKQTEAFLKIKNEFVNRDIVLLHGVTSSGKTEIYIHLIKEIIREGKQVLYLLPEIALTTQIIHRLKSAFGDKIGVYHSKFSDSERVEVYYNLLGHRKEGSPEYQIILGVRSSIFLPFSNLGLVIVDEEHENTYKQYDPSPRYNARDAAIVLAGMHHGKVLLGTATPSFESYLNAENEKYGLVELLNRYLDIQMPDLIVVNVREARRKKLMKTIFSPLLIDLIGETLDNKEQVILFQNRRGFSPYIECNSCGTIPYCKNCDVSLTYHKNTNRLNCHYCGYSIPNPDNCLACGSNDMQTRGFGTEKVEDEISFLFPNAKIARMDLDTTRTRKSYEKIIGDFENRKVDILIGTQMVSKGLDFDHVKVVGILNADNLLNFPDFRSFERSFQLIAQVSGRAGRKNARGRVIIQTSNPENTVIRHVVNNEYKNFYIQQISERKNFRYPPYYRLVKLTLRHRKLPVVSKAAHLLADELRKSLDYRVIGPEFPLINRVFNLHQKCILVKIERDMHFTERRRLMRMAIDKISLTEEFKGLQIVPDVDPYN